MREGCFDDGWIEFNGTCTAHVYYVESHLWQDMLSIKLINDMQTHHLYTLVHTLHESIVYKFLSQRVALAQSSHRAYVLASAEWNAVHICLGLCQHDMGEYKRAPIQILTGFMSEFYTQYWKSRLIYFNTRGISQAPSQKFLFWQFNANHNWIVFSSMNFFFYPQSKSIGLG